MIRLRTKVIVALLPTSILSTTAVAMEPAVAIETGVITSGEEIRLPHHADGTTADVPDCTWAVFARTPCTGGSTLRLTLSAMSRVLPGAHAPPFGCARTLPGPRPQVGSPAPQTADSGAP